MKLLYSNFLYLPICVFLYSSISAQQLFYLENGSAKLNKSNYDGTNTSVVDNTTSSIYGAAVDETNNKIYYTSVLFDAIYSINTDGSNKTTIISGINAPRGIALDGSNSKLYWAEAGSGKIRSSNLDGTNVTDVVSGLSSPVDVALDLVNNKLFWSDNGAEAKKISKSNMDGSTIEDVITTIDQVGGIDIDAEDGKLYWIDFGASDKIMRANLDGSNTETIITIASGSPRGIAISNNSDKLFWSDVVNSSIYLSTRSGASQSQIISSLSNPIGIAVDWINALPVQLVYFRAIPENGFVKLSWETATEINNYGFEIERKPETGEWSTVGFVPGHGNSNSPKSYEFIDENAPEVELEYRLKQIDTDGRFTFYAQTAKVGGTLTGVEDDVLPTEYSLEQNYPNPFNPTTTISYQLKANGLTKLVVYDLLGREVAMLVNNQQTAGRYSVMFNSDNLASGMYIYHLTSGDFVSTKKLLLMK